MVPLVAGSSPVNHPNFSAPSLRASGFLDVRKLRTPLNVEGLTAVITTEEATPSSSSR